MLNKIFGLFGTKSSNPSEMAGQKVGSASQADLNAHFETLGLPAGSDLNAARQAWKKELAKVHRDLYSDDPSKKQKAQEITHRLNTAYRALQDALF